MAPRSNDTVSKLPDSVLTAFHGRVALTLPETARALEMDVKTLRKHIEAGKISFRIKGSGKNHVHRVFSLSDVASFLHGSTVPAMANWLPTTRKYIGVTGGTVNIGKRLRKVKQ